MVYTDDVLELHLVTVPGHKFPAFRCLHEERLEGSRHRYDRLLAPRAPDKIPVLVMEGVVLALELFDGLFYRQIAFQGEKRLPDKVVNGRGKIRLGYRVAHAGLAVIALDPTRFPGNPKDIDDGIRVLATSLYGACHGGIKRLGYLPVHVHYFAGILHDPVGYSLVEFAVLAVEVGPHFNAPKTLLPPDVLTCLCERRTHPLLHGRFARDYRIDDLLGFHVGRFLGGPLYVEPHGVRALRERGRQEHEVAIRAETLNQALHVFSGVRSRPRRIVRLIKN
ncbi:MAG: hypothetical protein BWX71_00594 [Deltaproteobacteria bacterium ADurb.Bin072]|nr:MAG: hypothetical protein BWX71_00594 [Deltaproteobacteria bacterium ADurb.Bin072]